jgi:HEAT repeats/PBS lyase HEAT-like repeat
MANEIEAPVPLAPDEAARLTDFARACKAAARAVMLYPVGHPAIAATLGRIVLVTSPASLRAPLKVTVLPDGLLLDGRAPARADQAIGELAVLLHDHLVGELIVHPGGDLEAWRNFLLLLGRPVESVRGEGGIARLWTTMAGRHVELREIDYAEVLRERSRGESAAWDTIVANCLQGDAFALDDEAILALLDIAGDADRLGDLMAALETRAAEGGAGVGAKTTALLRMLRGIVEAVSKSEPDRLDPVLHNMASAVGHLSPDMMMGLLSHGSGAVGDTGDEETPRLVSAVVSRMSEGTIARFVSRNIMTEGTATDRLAQAFQTLVRDVDQRERMLALAHDDLAASTLGRTEEFRGVWNHITEKLLTSYSDELYVPDAYGRELSLARTQAIQVEQVSDDPPERLTAWMSTVATTALRVLDLTLLLDLLRIEPDPDRWKGLMTPVVRLIEDLLLVGDFEAAEELLAVLVREVGPEGRESQRQTAIIAIDTLVAGSMMHHIVVHLATIDEAQFARVQAMCLSLGEVVVRPIAEALSSEANSRTRERLTAIIIALGAVARRTVERLKSSPNAAVRRTAVVLLRQFGGSDALPDLTELLDDTEPQVQREAVRAIINIGTDHAYRTLEQALASGTTRSREAIMQSISGLRDERAVPLFTYILGHVDHRGALGTIYLRAVESLGALKDPDSVAPLKDVLYRGEWWAPRRTAAFRAAAAAALARIGTPEALAVLELAAATGSRGVRSAARARVAPGRGRAGREARR